MKNNYFYKIVNSNFYFFLVNYGLVLSLFFRFAWIIITLILTFFFSEKLGYSNNFIFDAISVLMLLIYYSIISNTVRYCKQKLWVPIETVIYLVVITIFFFIMMSLNKNLYTPANWNWLNIIVLTIQVGIRLFTIFFLLLYLLYWKQASIGAFFYQLAHKNNSTYSYQNPIRKTIINADHHKATQNENISDNENLESAHSKADQFNHKGNNEQTTTSEVKETVQSGVKSEDATLLSFKEMPVNSWFQKTEFKNVSKMTKLDFFRIATSCSLTDKKTASHANEWENVFLICTKTKLLIGVFAFHQSGNARPMTNDVLDYFQTQSPELENYIANNKKILLNKLVLNIDFTNNILDRGIYKYQQFATRKISFMNNFGTKNYLIN